MGKNILRGSDGQRPVKSSRSDVDANTLEVAADRVNDRRGSAKTGIFASFGAGKLVVIIASPDHWHAAHLAALKVGACRIVEKPTGRKPRDASRGARRGRVAGLHRRIGPHHVSG